VTGLATVLGLAAFWSYRHQQAAQAMARSMEVADAISVLEYPEALQDFEVIHHLSFVPARAGDGAVDLDLLAALQ
jgi:hypothetical protein